ncbi:endoglucanase 17-like, partial [Olea europaea var. sylvestris]
YICSLIPGTPYSSAQYTPGGLLFKMNDSNMQYVTSTSFLLVTYAKYLTSSHMVVNCGGTTVTPKKLRALAKRQVDYLLGDNPIKMSFMVGYGARYPLRIHHRGSSLPSIAKHPAKIQCSAGFGVMNSQSPNPNILMGAIVGGPDQHDRFPDQRSDYEQSEPATYINAPLVGSLAYLAHSFGQL